MVQFHENLVGRYKRNNIGSYEPLNDGDEPMRNE